MDLILAADLKGGDIVHGRSGNRDNYLPVVSPFATSSKPAQYLQDIRPRYLYVADLDRITGVGSHDPIIADLATLVDVILLDRGCLGPKDLLVHPGVINVIGTETCGNELEQFSGGYLSIDMKNGRVLPDGQDPVEVLTRAAGCAFDGCILLDIGGVGTQKGLHIDFLRMCRAAYPHRLLWGGGVASMEDLYLLKDSGFDGAIIATALHAGAVPIELIREGTLC